MKNVIMTNDNVLVKATYNKVVEAKGKEKSEISDKLEKIEIVKMGDNLGDIGKTLEIGDEVLINTGLQQGADINKKLDEKVPEEKDEIKIYYYSIKSFNIIAIIKK